MADLQINLPDAASDFAAAQIAAGRFGSMSDYLGALVSADEQMQLLAAKLGQDPRLETLGDTPGGGTQELSRPYLVARDAE